MGMARAVAAILGTIYVALGLIGFVVTGPLLGLFEVNGLHSLVHVVLGAALLIGATSTELAITMTRRVGVV
ncbi:MAG TPA: DUF4383 domain-containing protein, partial [Candidatus Limnocylindria bacterium]